MGYPTRRWYNPNTRKMATEKQCPYCLSWYSDLGSHLTHNEKCSAKARKEAYHEQDAYIVRSRETPGTQERLEL